MKLLITVFLSLLALVPLSGADWAEVAAKVKMSVVLVESESSTCSGFVVNQPANIVVTAAHCFGEHFLVDGTPIVRLMNKDSRRDILIVQIAGNFDKPPLRLASVAPKTGDEVASFGYGYALNEPFFKVHHVSSDNHRVTDETLSSVDSAFLPGMSGGPVFNQAGEVVGLIRLGNNAVGFFGSLADLKEKAEKFFELK